MCEIRPVQRGDSAASPWCGVCECACTAGAEFEKDDGRARPRDGRREAEAEAGSVNGMEESEKLSLTPPAAVSRCPADVAGGGRHDGTPPLTQHDAWLPHA